MPAIHSVLILFGLLTPLLLGAVVKIDIDGRSGYVPLEPAASSKELAAEQPEWAQPREAYLIFREKRRAAAEWKTYTFSFIPKRDGRICISRRGLSSKPELNRWVLYRDFKVSGAKLIFHAAAKINQAGMPDGVERSGHYHGLRDYVEVEKDKAVSVEFTAKSGGDEEASKYPAADKILPVPPKTGSIALKITVDGTAGGITSSPVEGKDGFRIEPFYRNKKILPGRFDFVSPESAGKNWTRYQIGFIPDLGGDVVIVRKSAAYSDKEIEWAEFRNFKVSGATHKRHITAPISKTSADGVERGTQKAPLRDIITVEKGRAVQLEFEARNGGSELLSKYKPKDFHLTMPQYKAGRHDDKIIVPAPGEKGAPYALYGTGAVEDASTRVKFIRQNGPSDAAEKFAIPVEILEEDGTARNAEIRFGLPLPEKMFRGLDNIRVLDPTGKEVDLQVHATGFYPDRSVKWALLTFQADLKAHEKSIWTVEAGHGVTRRQNTAGELKVAQDEKGFKISTGKLESSVGKDLHVLAEIAGIGTLNAYAVDENGKRADCKISDVILEEAGPVSATLRIDGDFIGARKVGGFTARLRYFAGSAKLKTVFTYRANDLTNEINELKSLHVILAPTEGKLASGAKKIFQGDDLSYWIDARQVSGFMPETDVWLSGGKRISFGLSDAGKRYPKAFAATPEGLDVQLLPEQPSKDFNSSLPGYLSFPFCDGNYRMMAGMNFTEEMIYDFSGEPAAAREPVAVIPRTWYARTGVIRGISADNLSEAFDRNAAAEVRRHLKRKAEQREYGFLNYGDWFGERGGNWGNNEYDFAYGLLTLFARTGERDIYRLGLLAARHQADVDVIHATPRREFLGGDNIHGVGHTGWMSSPHGKPKEWYGGIQQAYANALNGHSWCGGMFTAWNMSGRAETGDSALLLAAHFMQDSGKPYLLNRGNTRSHGWMLEGLMQAYDATGEEKYLSAAAKVAENLFKAQNLSQGGVWAYRLPPSYANGHENAVGNAILQVGITLQALHHYSIRAQRQEIRKNLEAAAGWLRRTWQAEAAGWPYVAKWDASPLWPANQNLNMVVLAGVKADGNPEADFILRTAMKFHLLRGTGRDGIGKDLAIDLFFAPVVFEMLGKMQDKFELALPELMNERKAGPRFMKLRGPARKQLEIVLTQNTSELRIAREFYNKRPNGKDKFTVSFHAPDGTRIDSFDTPVTVRNMNRTWKLEGRAGDIYRLEIDDDMSGYWEADPGNGAFVRIRLDKDSQFANGCPLYFRIRVPKGAKTFTVRCRAAHSGAFGMLMTDADGKIAGFANAYNNRMFLPWLKNQQDEEAVAEIKVSRKDASKESVYSLLTWSRGDIYPELEGIPAYLEYTRKGQEAK